MHELSIVQNVVRTTEEFAEAQDIPKVKKVVMEIGSLTGVIPKYMQMYYPETCQGTRLENSELVIEEIEAESFCRCCGEVFKPMHTRGVCPKCNSADQEILHGNELLIKEIAYEEQEN